MDLVSVLQKIQTLFNQGQFQQVISIVKPLLANYPKNSELSRIIGLCYRAMGDDRQALNYIASSLKLNDKQTQLHAIMGGIYKKSAQYDLSIMHYSKASNLEPHNCSYLNNQAFVHLNNNQSNMAKSLFEKSLKLNNSQVNPYIGLASVYSFEEKNELAIDVLLKALSEHPTSFIAINNLASCYKKIGDLNSAILYFNKANTLKANEPSIIESLAFLHYETNQKLKGLNILREGLKYNPFHFGLNSSLAKLLWESGDADFLAHYSKLPVEAMPFDLSLDYFYKLMKSEQLELADKNLTFLEKKYGKVSSLIIARSNYYYQLKEFQVAYNQLSELQNLRVLSNEELDWLGRHSLALGYFEEAVKIYQNLSNLVPRNQGYWCLLTTALREVDYDKYRQLCCYDDLVFIFDVESPSGYSSISKFNECLLDEISKVHVTEKEPLEQSVVGGTQTIGRIFQSENEVIKTAKKIFEQAIYKKLSGLEKSIDHPTKSLAGTDIDFVGAWSVWLKSAGFHKDHYHGEGWYSGVYYIQTPDDKCLEGGAGCLKFGQADLNLPIDQSADYFIKPKAGQMVLFPSFIWHGTIPFNSKKPRVSIAFDIAPKL